VQLLSSCLPLNCISVDLEWKVLYVGSAEDSRHDQTLEEVMVGPIPVGVNKFVLQAPSPNFDAIPQNDILGVTVVLVTCSFLDQEFVRIGYYVNNEYADPIDPEQPLPTPLELMKISRNILADQPRVTRFPIDWSGQASAQSDAPLQVALNPDEIPAEDDCEMNEDAEDDEDDEEEEEEGDEMAEEELGDEEDDDEEEEEEEEEMEEDGGMEIMNEDSMDVANMQSLVQ
jgi:histone chaperone ASF1